MTGYASVLAAAPPPAGSAPALALELRSVNGRFLDLSFKLPDELRGCEPALREILVAGLRRGKVELRAALQREGEAGVPLPGAELLEQLALADDRVRARLPDARPLSVQEVLQWARAAGGSGSVPPGAEVAAPEPAGPGGTGSPMEAHLLEAARRALQALLEARAREGAKLTGMLLERVARLRELAARAAPLVPEAIARQRERFLERWREALQAAQASAPAEASRPASTPLAEAAAQDRALGEAAAHALRIDVAEELSRLQAHLDEIERLLGAGGELGKRLDFLIQELHREANTLGSKAASLALTALSVEMRVLVEQMREQVQNIE
ncbi:MAG: YicC family protein [Rubrivivax sp.]